MIIIHGDERSTHGQIAEIMDVARQVGLVDQVVATKPQPAKAKGAAKPSRDDGIWQEAMSTDPDEWSDELKAQLLALHHPGSTIEEIAKKVRQRRLWQKVAKVAATDPDEWPDELKAQLLMLKPGSTIEEIVEEVRQMVFVEAVRQRMPWREATDLNEWPAVEAQLRALKPVTPTISYEIATATSAELAIYDVAGQHVRTVVLGHQSPGKHSIVWDGRDDAGRELSNGLYFYKLKTKDAEAEVVGETMLVR